VPGLSQTVLRGVRHIPGTSCASSGCKTPWFILKDFAYMENAGNIHRGQSARITQGL
jgi:hypothetical protein